MQIVGNGLQLNTENPAVSETALTEKLLSAGKSADNGQTASLFGMEPGTYFYGRVLELLGNKAVIGMDDGLRFMAKMETDILMERNQNLLFEVKSRENGTVALRPVSAESAVDVTAAKALKAAGLSITPKNVAIAGSLLEEKMPVDKQSIQKILRESTRCPDVPVKVLVRMEKAGLNVTPESAEQFLKYQAGEQALTMELENLADAVSREMEQLAVNGRCRETVELNRKLIDFLLHPEKENALSQDVRAKLEQYEKVFLKIERLFENRAETVDEAAKPVQTENFDLSRPDVKIGTVQEMLKQPEIQGQAETLSDDNDKMITLHDFADEMPDFNEPEELPEKILQKLIEKKEYRSLLKKALKEYVQLMPEEVAEKEKVQKVFAQIQRELHAVTETVQKFSGRENIVAKQAGNMEENLDFMQQLNQLYGYVQLPLKMAGRSAHGDLYVFADKKGLKKNQEELSAFVHLDMENLGAMDIFITLNGKKVGTKITLENESVLELFEEHIGELSKRLEEKGYQTEMVLNTGEAKPDFVQDILFRGETVGSTQRFSFDVKA